jgi:YesN/AraC family two-component response regulator
MSTLNCLIVDDEELALRLMALYVEKVEGLTLVATAKNAIEALSLFEKDTIDLVFLDIQMPELSGTALAKLLPEHIKVIFTSGYSEDTLEDIELTAVDYLLKPITFERFYQAVQKVKGITAK